MREPYFKVGEEVILQSKDCPEYNGDCIVTGVKYREGFDISLVYYKGYSYKTNSGIPDYHWWRESALRKKYPPSSEGFQDMMQKIKDNVLEGVK